MHRLFFEMKKNNCKYCVMEVSSQALKYDRVFGINFEIGCFLNIGEDHISSIEHSSFEDYYRSKLKIFDYCDKVVVSDELPIEHPKALFCGRGKIDSKKPLHYRISDIRVSETAQRFILDPVGEITIAMPGEFNIQNAAMAAIVCKEIGVPKGSILDGLYGARVSGRMELFRSERTGNVVIVDYAHNKLSYEALFDSIQKNYPNYRVVTIFGCPGKKAIKRRKDLPEIAERFSDFIYITEEDYGEEPLLKICDEIFENIYDKTKAEIELDRESALAKALARFEEPTLVLMLGKGRETRQKRGTTYVATPSDVELVEKYL